MTENQYEATKDVMRKAGLIRSKMSVIKNNISKWTCLEDHHRRNLEERKADGCKMMIEKEMRRLATVRKEFSELKLPTDETPATFKWVADFDLSEAMHCPKKISLDASKLYKKCGRAIHDTKSSAQNECDQLNSF